MKKYLFLLIFVSGCSLWKHGVSINPALANINPGQDANAVKVQGDIAPIKAPVKADLNAQLGVGNSTQKTNVGGNMTNDSEVIKVYIESYERIIQLLKKIIMAMAGIIGALIALVGWALKKAMNDNSYDDRFKEEMIKDRRKQ